MAGRREADAAQPPDAAVLQRHALRVAIAEGRAKEAKGAAEAARRTAEVVFAEARRFGMQSLKVVLPDGSEAGSLPILAGEVELQVDEDALLGVAVGNDPGDIETFVHPIALANPQLIAWVAEHFPELTGRRIEATARQQYLTEFEENNGKVLDRTQGERVEVGRVVRHEPTGRFQYRGTSKGWLHIREAIEAGALTEDGEIVEQVPDLGERSKTSAEHIDEDAGHL